MEAVNKAIESVKNLSRTDPKCSLDSEERLAAIANLEIVDRPTERNFGMLVELANSLLETPVSLISIVTDKKQFFVSSDGLGEPWATERETPLSHSFCQYVVKMDAPLVVTDSRIDPLVCKNLAIRDLDVGSYLGYPLRTKDGLVLGSFCVIDSAPRTWTDCELTMLGQLAKLAVSELDNRIVALRQKVDYENRLMHAQKMEAIGQFTTGVAHDFNNVLTVIQNFAELLQHECGDQLKPSSYIQQIFRTLDSATAITQQLLTCSRPKRETFEPVVLQDVIGDLLPLIEASSPENVQFCLSAKTKETSLVATRSSLIHQILTNLCSNSIDAMGDKGGKISIDIDEVLIDDSNQRPDFSSPPGQYVRLCVSDDGRGIPQEIIDRLYDPYFTTKPIGRGTGLGLWIVFGIVKEHLGEIIVKSELGKGATFMILLPIFCENDSTYAPPNDRSAN